MNKYYLELLNKAIKHPNKIFPFIFDNLKYKWIRYFKFRNRPFHEFYAFIMKDRIKKLGPKNAIGGNWDQVGKLQYDFLLSEGLKPQHNFLDFGCGALRLGIKLIPYLEPGKYWGADISKEILEFGNNLIKQLNLENQEPKLIYLQDNSFKEFKEFNIKFDFITAHSVFTHMPLEAIKIILLNVKQVMHKETRFYATYFESKSGLISNREQDFYYPKKILKDISNEYGFDIYFIDKFKYSQQMFMLKLK